MLRRRGSIIAGLVGAFIALPAAEAQEVRQLEDGKILIRFDEVNGTELTEFVKLFQELQGAVIHYEPKDIKDIKIHQLGDAIIRKDRLDIFFGAVLRNLDFLLVQYGPLDAGFWALRKTAGASGRGQTQLKALAQVVSV